MIEWKVVISVGCVIFIISEGRELKYYVNTDVLSPPPPHVPCHPIFQAVSCWLLTAKTWFSLMLGHVGLWWNKWHWGRFLSEHFSFSLSVSFHPCCSTSGQNCTLLQPLAPTTTESIWCTFGRWLSKLVLVLCVSWQLGNGAVPTAGVMAPNGGLSQPPQIVMEGTSHSSSNATDVDIPPEAQPPAPAATLVKDMDMNECSSHDRNRDLTGKFSFLVGKSNCISVIRRLQIQPLRTMSVFTKKSIVFLVVLFGHGNVSNDWMFELHETEYPYAYIPSLLFIWNPALWFVLC